MSKPLIEVRVVRHDEQRYDSWGDWIWDADGRLLINLSAMTDQRHDFLGAVHEILEALVCRYTGVTQEQVDAFDFPYEEARGKGIKTATCGCPITEDPGMDAHAPYRHAHVFAMGVEYGLARIINVDAAEYDKGCIDLYGGIKTG